MFSRLIQPDKESVRPTGAVCAVAQLRKLVTTVANSGDAEDARL